MTIDVKQSFRRGSIITEVHVDTSEAPCQHCNEMETHLDTCIMRLIRAEVVHTTISRTSVNYKTINKAKKANRQTQYRVVRGK